MFDVPGISTLVRLCGEKQLAEIRVALFEYAETATLTGRNLLPEESHNLIKAVESLPDTTNLELLTPLQLRNVYLVFCNALEGRESIMEGVA